MNSAGPAGDPNAGQSQGSDPSSFLERARARAMCRGLIEELSRDLPGDDAAIGEWIGAAARERDENLFTILLFAALAAGRAVDARVLIDGAALLPDTQYLALAAAHCSGDVASALIESSKRKGLGWERDAVALLMAGLWCARRELKAFPPELISRARMLARESRESFFAQVPLLALSNVIDSEALRTLVLNEGRYPDGLAEKMVENYTLFFSARIIDELPEAPQFPESWGKTVRRAVPRIGRNEPCPCGSGKKYKKCCFDKDQERLRRSSDVAGVTVEEIRANPEAHLSRDRLMSMRSHELARLDPARVSPELHRTLISRLLTFGEYESAIKFFEAAGIFGDLEGHWHEAVQFATMEGRKEIVRTLLRLHGIRKAEDLDRFPLMGFAQYLLMMDEKPCRALEKIEARSREAAAGGAANPEEELAYALLEGGFPGLGVLAARAAIPLCDPFTASVLLDKIHQARDELGLSPDEPFERIVEELSGQWDLGDDADIDALIESRNELDRKNAETRQLRREIDKLHEDLKRREAMLAVKQRPSLPAIAPGPPPPDELVVDLRARIETLKTELNQRHSERNQLRRELESTQSDLQKLKQRQVTAEAAREENIEEEREDALFEEGPSGLQAIRVPVFSERFRRSIESLSSQVVASTLRLIGRLAAGDTSAFAGSRRLQANPAIIRQRIGIRYRLLFSVKGESLEIVDLIERKELEKTIRNYGRSQVPAPQY